MTFDPFYENFLNSNTRKRELDKIIKIKTKILENFHKGEKRPKRKSPKKPIQVQDLAVPEESPNAITEQ